MKRTRRQVLQAGAGAVAAGTSAGCLDRVVGGAPAGEGAQTSFFLLYDVARNVAGDGMEVDSVVPFGQHGHGWEPSGQTQRDVQQSALFVYVGEGFQPWADDIVHNLESDDANTHVVEAWDGIDLLGDDADHEDGHDGEDHEGEDADHESDGESEDDGGHEDENDHDDGHENETDHDHAGRGGNPHFWLDPIRAATAVENVRDGLIEVDDGNADGYEQRADDYIAEIDALHRSFEDALEGASKDLVLVAGHDAFGYLGNRYGFEVHSLAGISPDEEPSNAAIREAQTVIADHDLEYVLAPALESDRAAEQLVDETDAEDVLEVAAISGRTDEWNERDWGYLEIMENVNLPTLRTALGAE